MNKLLQFHPDDSVVTCLKAMTKGETALWNGERVVVAHDIPLFHKMAVRGLEPGDMCYKYGEVIGRATGPIRPGDHVHIHNLESTRGRGDQAALAAEAEESEAERS